ncbi:class I SAM-dependent methyltransferase [Arthrobacter oryzae]|uniref:Methyltransferase family protein n=1 Tax=Arthrobacter oryzae TaxID=409290 RepID=A0A495ETH1_9MICC|nr:class I SAM-dependent methyltransferase [Arthrobacter oryzae]RKR19377.1 methyltransferase family protein [Arthrobacter oryzae]
MESTRRDLLESFVALLKSEGRHAVLGLDCGPGTDGLHFVQSGIHFTGVDPSEENIHIARGHGLEASVAGPAPLPFADAAFSSVWAVDALSGLPPDQWDDVVRELGRVAEPGAPIAVVIPAPGHHGAGSASGGQGGGGQDGGGQGGAGSGGQSGGGQAGGEGSGGEFTVLRSPA